jgi:hypothetical protein
MHFKRYNKLRRLQTINYDLKMDDKNILYFISYIFFLFGTKSILAIVQFEQREGY